MNSALALIALIAVVAARIYLGRLATETFDSLPEAERKRITRASGSY